MTSYLYSISFYFSHVIGLYVKGIFKDNLKLRVKEYERHLSNMTGGLSSPED
jgi:hypothetical protein